MQMGFPFLITPSQRPKALAQMEKWKNVQLGHTPFSDAFVSCKLP